jgi:NADPH2:quinone reductase
MKAIRIEAFGGPEVLSLVDVSPRTPGEGEVRVRIEASGVNFIDVYHRTGLYPNPLPLVLGLEGAGVVLALGPGVSRFRVGEAVAWSSVPGSYAEEVVAPVEKLVSIPAGVDPKVAAAAMLQGMTAHYLTRTTYPLKAGDTCLVHAAAGGVGLLLCQMAKERGARVIGTVSTEEKAALAREAGADHVIFYTTQDLVAEVQRITGGRGLEVVYDGVGKDTFEKGLACLAPRGMLALFGQSSGKVPPVDPSVLGRASLFLTRPSLFHYTADRASLEARSGDVLQAIAAGRLRVRIGATFPLAEAATAQSVLEARKTTGKVVLLP